MIKITRRGNLKHFNSRLERIRDFFRTGDLSRYGERGVGLLKNATPKDSEKTANSWYYEIKRTKTSVSLIFSNSNIQNGCNVAILLQYGHATRNGSWVEGIDYINPALKPLFDEIAEEIWKEATKA